MASSYRLDSAASYEGRYMYVTCAQTKDVSSNTSTIVWTLTVDGGESNNYTTGPTTLTINGVQVYNAPKKDWSSYEFPAVKGSVSGVLNIAHDSQGNAAVNVTLSTNIYTGVIKTASGTWNLDSIPRQATLTAAPNFNDEENPTITYTNPAGTSVTSLQACIANSTGGVVYVPYRDISKTGTSYTFSLTSAERQTLQNAASTSNTLSVRFYIKTVVGGSTLYSSLAKTLTIKDGSVIIAPSVVDVNTATVALTGDKNKLIKYFSNASCTLGAQARKGATLTGQSIKNGANTISAASGTFNAVESGKFVFSATDSRQNTVEQTVTKTLIEYVKLTCNISEAAPDASGKLTFKVNGNYFSGSFGTSNNSLTVQYRYKVAGGSYGSWQSMSASVSGSSYTATVNITGLDYKTNYVFEARATDKLTTINSEVKQVKTLPVFDWSKDDFAFNVPVSIEGDTITDFVIEQGTTSMGSNGTWYWRKWKSGRADCYGCRNYGNMGVSTAWGSLYRSESFAQSFPSGLFNAIPDVIDITFRASNFGAWIAKHEASAPSSTSSGGFIVVRPASATLSQAYISFNIIGRWK